MNLIKTNVTKLHELMQKRGRVPKYDMLPSEGVGTHEPTYRYKVTAEDVIGYGIGRSKKVAKHDAARDALDKLVVAGIYIPDHSSLMSLPQTSLSSAEETVPKKNSIAKLHELISINKLPPCKFQLLSDIGPPHQRLFTMQCEVGNFKKIASASTKKEAKQIGAQHMYQFLMGALPDLKESLSDDEIPPIENVMINYRDKHFTFQKRQQNYNMKVRGFSSAVTDIMKSKNLDYNNVWESIDDESEETLNEVLTTLCIKWNVEVMDVAGEKFVILLLDTKPNFVLSHFGKTRQEAMDKILPEAFSFLRIMSE